MSDSTIMTRYVSRNMLKSHPPNTIYQPSAFTAFVLPNVTLRRA